MRSLLWLLVALNALVFLAGASGALQRLPFLAPARTAAIDADAAGPSGGVPRLALLDEGVSAHARAPARQRAAPALGAGVDHAPAPAPRAAPPVEQTARVSPPAAAAAPAAPPSSAPSTDPGTGAPAGAPDPAEPPPTAAAAGSAGTAGGGGDATRRAPTCFEVGPLAADGTQAGEVERAATAAGGRVLGREVRGSGPARHWVLIEGLPDQAAALREQERLRAAGFADVMAVERPSGWGVSLGLFGQRSRALAHRDAVRAAGFHAQLAERRGGPQRMWLRVALTDSERAQLAAGLPTGAGLAPCSEEQAAPGVL